jgi:hypothetical protein
VRKRIQIYPFLHSRKGDYAKDSHGERGTERLSGKRAGTRDFRGCQYIQNIILLIAIVPFSNRFSVINKGRFERFINCLN